MKKLILAVILVAAACSKKSPPTITTFSADKTTITAGDPVTLTFAVTGATSITILPDPGAVTTSPVTVNPSTTGPYTLRAQNDAGAVSQDINITVQAKATSARIASFTALPSQVSAGSTVTLSWSVSGAASIKLSDGSANPATDVTGKTSQTVTPASTTTYTLTVNAAAGSTPASITAKAVVHVVAAPTIASFTASPGTTVNTGQAVTLSWDGDATSWSLSDGTTTTAYGPVKTATVHPLANVTYTLSGTSVGGTTTRPLAITVTSVPGVTLVYTAPTDLTGKLFKLVAGTCGSPCLSMPFRLTPVVSSVTMHGLALNIPLDSTKVILSESAFDTTFFSDSPLAAKALIGSGPLKDTLVIGVARKGSGTAVAADGSESADPWHGHIDLVAAGGKGIVFDGTTAAGAAAIMSRVQETTGKIMGVIAIGKLEVQ